jgi:hypothetical protein
MNKIIQIHVLMKICQSLFEYAGNLLYKSDNALEASVWRIYWHGLSVLDFVSRAYISSKHRLLWDYHLNYIYRV